MSSWAVPWQSIQKSISSSCVFSNTNLVTHTHANDVESLFHVLLWIIIMYSGPLGCEHQDIDPQKTILGHWINNDNPSTALVIACDAKTSFLVIEKHNMDFHEQVSPYFHDLLPLTDEWRTMIAKNIHPSIQNHVTFQDILPIFNRFLTQMPNEKLAEIMNAVQGIWTNHTKLVKLIHLPDLMPDIPMSMVPQKRLSECVRSMDNPLLPGKCFKCTY